MMANYRNVLFGTVETTMTGAKVYCLYQTDTRGINNLPTDAPIGPMGRIPTRPDPSPSVATAKCLKKMACQ